MTSALSKTSIQIDWTGVTSSPSNGYSSVTAYEIYWNAGTGTDPSTLADTITAPTVTKTFTALTAGSTYYFKILAKNVHGSSIDSAIVNQLSADVPDANVAVVITESGTNVVLTWATPTGINGAAVSANRVLLYNKGTTTYTEYSSLCDGSNVATLTCNVAMSEFTSNLGYTAGDFIKAKA